jgi:hypothetical protein
VKTRLVIAHLLGPQRCTTGFCLPGGGVFSDKARTGSVTVAVKSRVCRSEAGGSCSLMRYDRGSANVGVSIRSASSST